MMRWVRRAPALLGAVRKRALGHLMKRVIFALACNALEVGCFLFELVELLALRRKLRLQIEHCGLRVNDSLEQVRLDTGEFSEITNLDQGRRN
jgi:hypothetical protein